ncbi:endolytic transglycosylase MltG [Nonomuraea sp. KC401]|uniref:endolytic transglycosylase MltG n=1 Tax=unclassified Nonomuraea TaxID=2593643 RepID=UPI0010FEA763|nr:MULTISPECIES: endolytic transglycosylase MltG [unclassified Nonomuraea]NBE93455.1 endolytic transglycosylase MltG [Nonomuraea sp. K271]TLF81443.1 endolytic transglycosylase MltG [Nonomuraea sp. KC401]
MSDLDLNSLLGAEDDEGPARRRGRGGSRRGSGRRRRRRRNRGRFIAPLLAFVVLAGIIGGGGYYGYMWLNDALVPDDYTGQGTGEVVIEIQSGQSASDVAVELERKGVVASVRAFTNAIANAGASASLQPGSYKLRKGMSAENAVALLDPDKRQRERVTIKEGLRLSDTLTTLAEETGLPLNEFKAAAKDVEGLDLPSYAKGKLEGYAFPATFEVQPKTTPQQILAAMVDRYKKTAKSVELEDGAKDLGHTPHEIVIIASIIQAEAGRYEDMPKIARVIYNRLEREPPMKLAMDSTVMYALNKYRTAATFAETKIKSKYNTYRYEGLPPGPIANPGDHAIEAALNPAKGDWLYFVATDPKSKVTKFATTEAERQALLAEYRANGG